MLPGAQKHKPAEKNFFHFALAFCGQVWYHVSNTKGGNDMLKPLSARTLGQRTYRFHFSGQGNRRTAVVSFFAVMRECERKGEKT